MGFKAAAQTKYPQTHRLPTFSEISVSYFFVFHFFGISLALD
jgi:hypothetical protein